MSEERTCRWCGLADASVKTFDYSVTYEHRSPSACITALRKVREEAEAAHTERVVRWCYLNPPIQPLTGADCETDEEYLARALAAAKGGA